MTTRLTLIHALSPLHAGTGQAVGTIDLPIARERPTGIPLLPGSSLKGALRARGTDDALTKDVFGPETANASEHAGAVQLSDAHVVLLPVRSVAGTWAWATSPYLLQRFARTAREGRAKLPALPPAPAAGGCRVVGETLVVRLGPTPKVVFEDLDFDAHIEPIAESKAEPVEPQGPLATFALKLGEHLFPQAGSPDADAEAESWRQSLVARLCLIHDDAMTYLLEHATEVAARIRLDPDTKTVAQGALWYQESLPAETVLAGLAVAADVRGTASNGRTARKADDLFTYLASLTAGSLVQLGGKSSVGHGSCLVHFAGGA